MMLRGPMALTLIALCVASIVATDAQTKATGKVPPFSLAYFVGEWTFDWTVPDSPLGPGGDLVGKETFRLLQHDPVLQRLPGYAALPASLLPKGSASLQAVESWIDATGPAGPVRTRALMTYDPLTGAAVRHEIDSTGNVVTKRGKIAGDLGGIYAFHWETEPFRLHGISLRLRGRTVAFSPQNYREFQQYAVDGDTFVALGQPWYGKAER